MKKFCFLALWGLTLFACQSHKGYEWEKQDDDMVLKNGDIVIGKLITPEVEGLELSKHIETIDSVTFKVACSFVASKDMDSARLYVDFVHLSKSDFWMIPSVSYNGNDWGQGKEPKGAKANGEWRTISYRRTPIAGAVYSEGQQYAVATWSDVPQNDKEDFSVSVQPEEAVTTHRMIWPEEEMPVTYVSRDSFEVGYREVYPIKSGEKIKLSMYIHVTPVLENHAAMRSFLQKAWELAEKPKVKVYEPAKLWDLGVAYAKDYLWAEEKEFKGFNIGLNIEPDGIWKQRSGGKYEIGWCGQNASLANSLLFDYLKHGNQASLDKGIATLDAWVKGCRQPNGLFITHYDYILNHNKNGVIDACNLGTASVNFFEAYDLAKQCGLDRPEYEQVAYAICDFVVADQQENGCYAKGWKMDGECLYRDGTIGCFIVPAMVEAYRRSQDEKFLRSATKAYEFYVNELKTKGFTTAGALDTWCIDKESSIALLRSALRLYKQTGDQHYIDDAVSVSYYLSTWLWHYTGVYPVNDNFTVYGYQTFGGTSVSVQHNHLDPYALYWVPEWVELAELTGDNQWKDKALAIWRNGNQLISDGTLEINGWVRPAGSQNEAYFECRWGFGWGGKFERINTWLVAWPGAFRLETIRRLYDQLEILAEE